MKRKTADEMQIEIFRKMSPDQKLKIASDLRNFNLQLLEAGIRSREGDLTAEKMRLRILEHILPPRLFAKFYGSSK